MHQPIINISPFTKILLLICVAFWILIDFVVSNPDTLVENLAFVPALVTQKPWMIITYQFLHGGFLHLAVNGAMLAALGNGVEPLLGKVRFVIYFLLCGILAVLAEYTLNPLSDAIFVGASGSISGLLGGVLTQRYLKMKSADANARAVFIKQILVLMIGMILIGIFNIPNIAAGIAWVTHIAGFLSGIALLTLFLPKPKS